MKFHTKNKIIYALLISLCVLLLIGMFFVYLFTDISEIFADIVSVVAIVIGAFASVIEYKKNKAIDISNDILTIYGAFIDVPTNKLIQYKLEVLKRRNINLFTDEDDTGIKNYLAYFNGVAQMVLSNNIKIGKINTILGYRFFLIMNCPYIQQREIIPNASAYLPCIKLHKVWGDWSKKHNFKRSGDAQSLENNFDKYLEYAEKF